MTCIARLSRFTQQEISEGDFSRLICPNDLIEPDDPDDWLSEADEEPDNIDEPDEWEDHSEGDDSGDEGEAEDDED